MAISKKYNNWRTSGNISRVSSDFDGDWYALSWMPVISDGVS